MRYEEQWKHADMSLCRSRGHEPRLESVSRCRWLSMRGDAGPKPGHENCEPALSAEGIGRLLGIEEPLL